MTPFTEDKIFNDLLDKKVELYLKTHSEFIPKEEMTTEHHYRRGFYAAYRAIKVGELNFGLNVEENKNGL